MPPPVGYGALSDDARLTSDDVCLSRTSGLSREQRGLRIKLAKRQPTSHVTRTHTFKVKRSKVNLQERGILWQSPAQLVMPPPPQGAGMRWCASWRLSVAYIRPKSRTEKPRKNKIGRGSPRHTWLGHHFQGQKVKGQLAGAGTYCGGLPRSLLEETAVILVNWKRLSISGFLRQRSVTLRVCNAGSVEVKGERWDVLT